MNLADAACRLGVSPRTLRGAIRAGHLQAPPLQTATAPIPVEWLASAQAAVEASPQHLARRGTQVAPFARYEGTSAWRKYRVRVRAYTRFRAAAE